jgi:NitT/TauT family transport system permease protein
MVQLPHPQSALFGGFKVAAALAATAEFVASDRGLGYLLLQYNGYLETSMAFAAVFVVLAMGLALYGVVELLEGIAVPWHVSRRRLTGTVVTGDAVRARLLPQRPLTCSSGTTPPPSPRRSTGRF